MKSDEWWLSSGEENKSKTCAGNKSPVAVPLCEKWWDKAKCWWADWLQWQGPGPEILTHQFFCHGFKFFGGFFSIPSLQLGQSPKLHQTLVYLTRPPIPSGSTLYRFSSGLCYRLIQAPSICSSNTGGALSSPIQSHKFNLLPWVGMKEGMVQNGRRVTKNMFYNLFYSFVWRPKTDTLFVVSNCDMSLLADVYQELVDIMFMLKVRWRGHLCRKYKSFGITFKVCSAWSILGCLPSCDESSPEAVASVKSFPVTTGITSAAVWV